jgi:hypothetical protein
MTDTRFANIDWKALTDTFRDARSEEARDAAFKDLCAWVATGLLDDAPDGAKVEGAIQILSAHGVNVH